MQFFPAAIAIAKDAVQSSALSSAVKNVVSENPFGAMLSSFIEADRYVYTGRPAGFAGFGPESGTLDDKIAARIAGELRSRKVSELSIGQLETLAASGSPLTIGTVFKTLSGQARLTESLSDQDLESFSLALDRLGFSKLEKEEMIALSDQGNTKGMWALLSKKLDSMEMPADLNQKEFSALLKGLDSSAAVRKTLLSLFTDGSGELETRVFSGEALAKMLTPVLGEYAEREQAAAYARTQARSAIVASLEAAKIEKNNAPVENFRGSRHQEQKEALMHSSVRKNTGIDHIIDDNREQPVLFKNTGRGQEQHTQQAFARSADTNPAQRQDQHGLLRSSVIQERGQDAALPRNAVQERVQEQRREQTQEQSPLRHAVQGMERHIPVRLDGQSQEQRQERAIPVHTAEQRHERGIPVRNTEHSQIQQTPARNVEPGLAQHGPARNAHQEQGQEGNMPARSAGQSHIQHTPANALNRSIAHNQGQPVPFQIVHQEAGQAQGHGQAQPIPARPVEHNQMQHIMAQSAEYTQAQTAPARSVHQDRGQERGQEQGQGHIQQLSARSREQSQVQNIPGKNAHQDRGQAQGHTRNSDARHDAEQSFERNPFAPADFQAMRNPLQGRAENAQNSERSAASPATDRTAGKLLHNIQAASDALLPEVNSAPAASAQNLNNMARTFRQEIFSQVEQGILSGAHNGSSRLTLQLNPVELGVVTVTLSVHQGEVRATIRAEQEQSAGVLREQMAELRASLEAEGLKVKELDVQTSSRELNDQWNGHKEHNLLRDAEERDRMMRLARIRRNTADAAGPERSETPQSPETEQTGLHIVA